MKVGVFLPYTEIPTDPVFIRDFAQASEALGYTHLHVPDHPARGSNEIRSARSEGRTISAMYDPFVLLGHLAGITTRLELVTSVLVLPQRQTLLVAKQAAEVSILSGGRLRLGIGTGAGPKLEYDALDQDYASRGRRQEEQVEVLRLLWSNDFVNFSGQWHRFDGVGIDPRPEDPIPVWFGGGNARNPQTAERVLERAARLGDGWMPLFRPDDERSVAALERLRGYIRQAGRDPATFGIEGFTHIRTGGPERWRERLEAWASAGATHVALRTIGAGLGPNEHMAAIRQYREAIEREC